MYVTPYVEIVGTNGLGVSELAARTCYSSFDKSENSVIDNIGAMYEDGHMPTGVIQKLREIDDSELLKKLVWINFHGSVVEHTNVTFFIHDVPRGVLQELARHRIQSISVKSTRYTLGNIISAALLIFHSNLNVISSRNLFNSIMEELDPLTFKYDEFARQEYMHILEKLELHFKSKAIVHKDVLSKRQLQKVDEISDLMELNKYEIGSLIREIWKLPFKRNIGDDYKFIVSDNFSTDIVSTFNLRSLKNFIELRDSGAAWEPMRILAKEMFNKLPDELKGLVKRIHKDEL